MMLIMIMMIMILISAERAEVKPDWCDPSPANPRVTKRLGSSSTSGTSPSSPLVTPAVPVSPSVPVERPGPSSKEWFCDLCHGLVPQRREIHFASLHFKAQINILPEIRKKNMHFEQKKNVKIFQLISLSGT